MLAFDSQNLEEKGTLMIEWANVVFSSIFFVEMLIKMAAIGCNAYVRGKGNLLDIIINFGSIIDLISHIHS